MCATWTAKVFTQMVQMCHNLPSEHWLIASAGTFIWLMQPIAWINPPLSWRDALALRAASTSQQQQQSLCIIATLRFRAIGVYKRKEIPPPIFLGGGFSELNQVTSQTQLSRPITLGHYTSWNADSVVNIIGIIYRPRVNDLGHTSFFGEVQSAYGSLTTANHTSLAEQRQRCESLLVPYRSNTKVMHTKASRDNCTHNENETCTSKSELSSSEKYKLGICSK